MWLFRRKNSQQTDKNEPVSFVDQQKDDALMQQQELPSDTQIPYALPNNLQEVNRLDFQHYILRQILKTNYLAPIDLVRPPQNILDVGCGTGRWLAEMGQQFPDSQLVGLDYASPPEGTHFPETAVFVQGNVLKGLPFTDDSFDFVHQRLLVVALPYHSWPFVIQELLRVTRPGGWIELGETDGEFSPCGPAMQQFAEWSSIALRQRGIETLQVRNIPNLLEIHKLQHIEKRTITIPIGRWAGHLGRIALVDLQSAQQGLKPVLMMANGLISQQYDEVLNQMYQEYERLHATLQYTVVYGQCP